MRIFVIVFLLIIAFFAVDTGTVNAASIKTLGKSKADRIQALAVFPNGDFIAAGSTAFSDPDNADAWIIKFDKNGRKLWDKTFGQRNLYDQIISAAILPDNSLVVAGTTQNSFNDRSSWIKCFDGQGNKLWHLDLTISWYDRVASVIALSDSSLIVARSVRHVRGPDSDVLIAKIGSSHQVAWQKFYGSKDISDDAGPLVVTTDAFILAGVSAGVSSGAFGINSWIIGLQYDGKIIWHKSLNMNSIDSIIALSDRLYLSGSAFPAVGAGGSCGYVICLDKSRNKVWDKHFAEDTVSVASMAMLPDQSIVFSITSISKYKKAHLVHITRDGDVLWDKTYDVPKEDTVVSVTPLPNGNLVMAGQSGPFGDTGAWIVLIDGKGEILQQLNIREEKRDVNHLINE